MSEQCHRSLCSSRWALHATRAASLAVLALHARAGFADTPRGASAPAPSVQQADTLFDEAKKLRDHGDLAEACSKFAQSKQLSPGIGVSLSLADCYERMGRAASAFTEFTSAERTARERNDSRADVAHTRAKALEPRVSRLIIAASTATAEGTVIKLDGNRVLKDQINVPLAVDPGHHVVSVAPRSGPARSQMVNVQADSAPATVQVDDAQAATPATPSPQPPVSAPPAQSSPLADALFAEGKRLREGGQWNEACAKFAQSQALSAGVGITLYLAACYEHLGRTASAWTEFVMAEKAARDQGDKREAVAHERAAALEPKLLRLTIVVSSNLSPDTALVQLDGRTVPPAMWSVALVTDPGDHLVTLQAPGIERRTFPVQMDQRDPAVTVQVGPPAGTSSGASSQSPAAPQDAAPSESQASTAEHRQAVRRWAEIGLLGGAGVAAGVGVGLLVVKNDSMSNGGAGGGRAYVDPVATTVSKVAFGVAGAAAAAAIVLYLTTPHEPATGLYLSPAPMVGGGGAFLHGSF
jgi:hypothetical protein